MAALAHQIRPHAAGSSAGVQATLRNAEAGAVGETCASVSATQDAAPSTSPESQDAGQPDHARNASDEVLEGENGDISTGQSEECVATSEAVEASASADDAASGSNRHSHDGGSS